MAKQIQIFKNEILRYPRLDTVVMIEETIRKARKDFTITSLWKKLKKKVMWQTYRTALDYIEYSGKILIDDKKNIVWIWDPEGVARIKKKGVLMA